MSAVQLPEPAGDFPSTETRGMKRIAVIVALTTVWLALGALAGLLIALSSGLIQVSC